MDNDQLTSLEDVVKAWDAKNETHTLICHTHAGREATQTANHFRNLGYRVELGYEAEGYRQIKIKRKTI